MITYRMKTSQLWVRYLLIPDLLRPEREIICAYVFWERGRYGVMWGRGVYVVDKLRFGNYHPVTITF